MAKTFKIGKCYKTWYRSGRHDGIVWVVDRMDSGRAYGRIVFNRTDYQYREWNSALPECHEELTEEESMMYLAQAGADDSI